MNSSYGGLGSVVVIMAILGAFSMGTRNALSDEPKIGIELEALQHPEAIATIAWSPDGRHLATANGFDNRIYCWDLEKQQLEWTVQKEGPRHARSLDFDLTGRLIITSSSIAAGPENNETTISLIPIETGTPIKQLSDIKPKEGSNVSANFVLSQNRKILATILGPLSGRIALYNTTSWDLFGHIGPLTTDQGNIFSPTRLALDASRRIVAASLPEGEIQVWDLIRNSKKLGFRGFSVGVQAMAFNNATGALVVGGDGSIVSDRVFPVGEPSRMVTRQDDGKSLVRSYDPSTGRRLMTYEGPGGTVSSLAISPDGRYITATKGPGFLLIWDAVSGELLAERDYGSDWVGAATFSPDGRKLAYAVNSVVHVVDLSPTIFSR